MPVVGPVASRLPRHRERDAHHRRLDDAAAFTRILAERLGVGPAGGNLSRVNESLSPAEMYWYPRIARLVLAFRSQRLYRKYVRAAYTPVRMPGAISRS